MLLKRKSERPAQPAAVFPVRNKRTARKPVQRSDQRPVRDTDVPETPVQRLRAVLDEAGAVIVGAGAGLSTSAGFVYSGERFKRYFPDFEERYGFHDMYTGGFYPFETLEEYWAYWSRYVWLNRYADPPKPVYDTLLSLIREKDQKAGFDKKRLFYTQGDYGLFQCSAPCSQETYDNKEIIRKMVESQGYRIAEDGTLNLPEGAAPERKIPSELVPHCPKCGRPMTMNLRADNSFVQDEGWYRAAERYEVFLRRYQGAWVLFLELGVGYNTPGIVKFSFRRMTARNPKAVYACVNLGEAGAPREIANRSICIDGDIGEVLKKLK